jgi:LmbE family N-acetylglucosaminyl deacetylase
VASALFLSPHPDDLVYSAFCALTENAGDGTAVVFFNVSRFTKRGLLPKYFVTMVRSIEERLILARLRIRSSFLWMEDSSCRRSPIDQDSVRSKLIAFHESYRYIYCPLGIYGHLDHLAVRSAGIDYWLKSGKKSKIRFYEDLPYAARVKEVESEVETCVSELTKSCGPLSIHYHPMNFDLVRRKLFFSRLYLTQNNHSKLLKKHAEELGKQCNRAYAERYVSSA